VKQEIGDICDQLADLARLSAKTDQDERKILWLAERRLEIIQEEQSRTSNNQQELSEERELLLTVIANSKRVLRSP
jgi:hypothetical protein